VPPAESARHSSVEGQSTGAVHVFSAHTPDPRQVVPGTQSVLVVQDRVQLPNAVQVSNEVGH
jgi:hypothetical protein